MTYLEIFFIILIWVCGLMAGYGLAMLRKNPAHQFLTELIDALNDKSELSIWEKCILKRAKEIIKNNND